MDVLTSRTEKRTKVLPFDVCCETILIKISTVFGFSKRVTEICAALIRETKQKKIVMELLAYRAALEQLNIAWLPSLYLKTLLSKVKRYCTI